MKRTILILILLVTSLGFIAPASQGQAGGSWDSRFEKAMKDYKDGKLPAAEMQFLQLLKESEKLGPRDLRQVRALDALVQLYRTLNNNAKAEGFCRRALAIRERVLGPEHAKTSDNVQELALLTRLLNKFAESEALYKRAIVLREKIYGPTSSQLSQSYRGYSDLLRKMGRTAEADQMRNKALEILRSRSR